MHCFFCRTIGPVGTTAKLEERDFKHLFKTLRSDVGEPLELTDGKGVFAMAEVGPERTIIVKHSEVSTPPNRRVHMYIAPPKKLKMDVLLKQCAEVGVWSINPFLSARSVSTPEKDEVVERWHTLLLEGCKQSKNPFLPQINGLPMPFKVAVKAAVQRGYRGFFGSPVGNGKVPDLTGVSDVAWFVGPEGGFTNEEENFMRENGIVDLRIGRWVLRVETAAVCGCLVLQQ